MKKSIFVFAGVALLALASCNKKFECVCVSGADFTETVETHKGKDAEEACSKGSSVLQLKVCVPKD